MNKIKKILLILSILLALPFTGITVYAEGDVLWDSYTVPSTRQKERLYDAAYLLTSDEQEDILTRLDQVSEKWACNVVILTVDSHSGPIQDYADDYFDYNGFGADYNGNGILFMLSMDDREWAFSTSGSGIDAFTDYGQEVVIDAMLSDLSDDDYYSAFCTYISKADKFLEQYNTEGYAYDVNNTYRTSEDILQMLLFCVLGGFAFALIPIFVMKAQLSTVHKQVNASGYQTHQGIHMRFHKDQYLRTHVTHTPIPKDNDSSRGFSGGSSVHHSSSGSSHGGSHGHF